MEHTSLLGPFESYEENVLLQIWALKLYSQHFISFVTYDWA